MELLLAKLLIPLVVILIVTAIGIVVLMVEYRREGEALPAEQAPSTVAAGTSPARPAGSPRPASSAAPARASATSARDTDSALRPGEARATNEPGGRPAGRSKPRAASSRADREAPALEPAGPSQPARSRSDEAKRPRAEGPATPAVPPAPRRSGPDLRLNPAGSNIVLNVPVSPRDYGQLPGKLEVIYGNFSPNDPREILFFTTDAGASAPRYTFSKAPGEGVFHIQLNHYTVTPQIQAALACEEGRHVLYNTVPTDEMDRYQTRINGIPMKVDESHVLAPGDIISMGIFRLKLTV